MCFSYSSFSSRKSENIPDIWFKNAVKTPRCPLICKHKWRLPFFFFSKTLPECSSLRVWSFGVECQLHADLASQTICHCPEIIYKFIVLLYNITKNGHLLVNKVWFLSLCWHFYNYYWKTNWKVIESDYENPSSMSLGFPVSFFKSKNML